MGVFTTKINLHVKMDDEASQRFEYEVLSGTALSEDEEKQILVAIDPLLVFSPLYISPPSPPECDVIPSIECEQRLSIDDLPLPPSSPVEAHQQFSLQQSPSPTESISLPQLQSTEPVIPVQVDLPTPDIQNEIHATLPELPQEGFAELQYLYLTCTNINNTLTLGIYSALSGYIKTLSTLHCSEASAILAVLNSNPNVQTLLTNRAFLCSIGQHWNQSYVRIFL